MKSVREFRPESVTHALAAKVRSMAKAGVTTHILRLTFGMPIEIVWDIIKGKIKPVRPHRAKRAKRAKSKVAA
jgi:hypothetical protein